MTPPPNRPLYLERRSYRRRRLRDAARLLPILGAVLFALPVLWAATATGGRTAAGFVYVFAVWAALIVAAYLISRRLTEPDGTPPGPDDDTGPR